MEIDTQVVTVVHSISGQAVLVPIAGMLISMHAREPDMRVV